MKHRRKHRVHRPETRAERMRRLFPPIPEPIPNPITGLVYCETLLAWGVVCEGHEPAQRRSNA